MSDNMESTNQTKIPPPPDRAKLAEHQQLREMWAVSRQITSRPRFPADFLLGQPERRTEPSGRHERLPVAL